MSISSAPAQGLYELLHGKQKGGFGGVVEALQRHKLAKWTLVTVFPAYHRPRKEVLAKPSTAKMIIDRLDPDLAYHSTLTWPFYRDSRKAINGMRSHVDDTLAPSNSMFCGFRMMELGG